LDRLVERCYLQRDKAVTPSLVLMVESTAETQATVKLSAKKPQRRP